MAKKKNAKEHEKNELGNNGTSERERTTDKNKINECCIE